MRLPRRSWQALVSALILPPAFAPVAAIAQGCGPTRLKVSETILLPMSPARAWALVGNFQDMSWDVEALRATGRGGNEPDKATREIALKDGATLGESLYKYDAAAMTYSYHIDKIDVARLPVQNVSATLDVVPDGAGSLVRWKAVFYRSLSPDEGAPDAADERAKARMRAYLRSGLDGLKGRAGAPRT